MSEEASQLRTNMLLAVATEQGRGVIIEALDQSIAMNLEAAWDFAAAFGSIEPINRAKQHKCLEDAYVLSKYRLTLLGTAMPDELYQDPVQDALRKIMNARDYVAEHGSYPAPPLGPGEDQEFDDWAADVAGAVLLHEEEAESWAIDEEDARILAQVIKTYKEESAHSAKTGEGFTAGCWEEGDWREEAEGWIDNMLKKREGEHND